MIVFAIVALCSINGMTAVVIDCPSEPSSLPDYLIIGLPKDCQSDSCNYIVRIGPNFENSSFVDFYLETTATGYGAVGFSQDRLMPSTDVVGCGQNSDGTLRVRDAFNTNYFNYDDPNQDGMCIYNVTYHDKRIRCRFSRYGPVINEDYDFQLNDSYYLLLPYANNQNPNNNNFPIHSLTSLPVITVDKINVYEDNSGNNDTSGSSGKLRQRLIRVHGLLMIVAWPFLAVIGIFFSAWTKPAFPKGQWFQFHRALMIVSVLVAVIGFIIIFIANKDNSVPGVVEFSCKRKISHFIIGVIVTAFQILNPLIGLCRCKPESNRRVIFNFIHGAGIGFTTELLALVNVGLGIVLFQSDCANLASGNHILWIYLTWLAFLLIFQVGLFCTFTISSLWNNDASLAPTVLKPFIKVIIVKKKSSIDQTSDMYSLQTDEDIHEDPMRSRDSNIRSGALGIFCIVTLIIAVILVVLIAIDGGTDS